MFVISIAVLNPPQKIIPDIKPTINNVPNEYLDNNFLSSLKIYAQGQNIWTYTPWYECDPEVGLGSEESQGSPIPGELALYSYPQTQSFSIGIDIKF